MPPDGEKGAMHGKADRRVQDLAPGDIDRAVRIDPVKQIGRSIDAVFEHQRFSDDKPPGAGLGIEQRLQHHPPFGNELITAPGEVLVSHGGEFGYARV